MFPKLDHLVCPLYHTAVMHDLCIFPKLGGVKFTVTPEEESLAVGLYIRRLCHEITQGRLLPSLRSLAIVVTVVDHYRDGWDAKRHNFNVNATMDAVSQPLLYELCERKGIELEVLRENQIPYHYLR
jgi:hypothetical protein